jgi:predicted RNA binding protein YcfA (HicA-like mRNA interferase family)
MRRRELEGRLRELGWRLVRRGRRHDIWEQEEREVAVPRHVEINEYTAKAIIQSAKGEKP